MSEELARYEDNQISPKDFDAAVEEATDKAKTLTKLVESQGLSKNFGGDRPHLRVEALELLGMAYGLSVGTGEAKLIKDDGAVTGAFATAWVYDQSGGIRGRAEALCGRDEPNWRGKSQYALVGMAQTRAAGRALRQVLGWVVVLAGYDPTPADEMPDDPEPFTTDLPSGADDPMQCPIHHKIWRQSALQKEQGRDYGHPNDPGVTPRFCDLTPYVNGALETLEAERGMKESEIAEIRTGLFGDTPFAALEAHQKLALVAAAQQAAAGGVGTTEDF